MIDPTVGGPDMAIAGYDASVAAQVAAVFLIREGGSMDKLKLVKLMYLAEREHVRLYREPMFYDQNFSLPQGPAGTNTIDGLNGRRDVKSWRRFLSAFGLRVRVRGDLREEDFEDISEAYVEIIDRLSERFRDYSAEELVRWTHQPENVPEYVETEERRLAISDVEMAQCLGLPNPEAYARRVLGFRKDVGGWTA